MKQRHKSLFPAWLAARRLVLGYVAALFALFFIVYGIYGHPWHVAGYAAMLGAALGLGLCVWDYGRFRARHVQLSALVGRFPTGSLPEAEDALAREYQAIIRALEAERLRLEAEQVSHRRDAEEYYTLWAHQIKTPLAAMNLLLQRGRGPEREEALALELYRTGQYVDMVLQYQRLSSLQSDLLLSEHTLSALVKQAARQCAPLFIYKDLALDTAGVSGSIVTDEKWFSFVLEQLLSNAAKYTAQGTVRVYCEGPDCLVVEDTGVGIPAEDLPRVFERGFTGAVGRSERSSTGIGLFLCRRILARLGFGISLSSTPGVGTRALLDLRQRTLEMD